MICKRTPVDGLTVGCYLHPFKEPLGNIGLVTVEFNFAYLGAVRVAQRYTLDEYHSADPTRGKVNGESFAFDGCGYGTVKKTGRAVGV